MKPFPFVVSVVLLLVVFACCSSRTHAFHVGPAWNKQPLSLSSRKMMMMIPMEDAAISTATTVSPPMELVQTTTPNTYSNLHSSRSTTSSIPSATSSVMISLQERKIPTPEEIAAKKRNFNLWFWGGGFVAPFLATFYYFGFKFWEK